MGMALAAPLAASQVQQPYIGNVRLRKEYENIMKIQALNFQPGEKYFAGHPILHKKNGPADDDHYKWRAAIAGPIDSPYSDRLFELDIKIPENYPYAAPSIQFLTPIYHANVSPDGSTCLGQNEQWSPAMTLDRLLCGAAGILSSPDVSIDQALDQDAAIKFGSDQRGYESHARAVTEWPVLAMDGSWLLLNKRKELLPYGVAGIISEFLGNPSRNFKPCFSVDRDSESTRSIHIRDN